MLPRRPRLQRPRLVGQFGVMHGNDQHGRGVAGAAADSMRHSPARIVTDGALALSQLPEAADYTAGRGSQRQLMRQLLAHREEVAF